MKRMQNGLRSIWFSLLVRRSKPGFHCMFTQWLNSKWSHCSFLYCLYVIGHDSLTNVIITRWVQFYLPVGPGKPIWLYHKKQTRKRQSLYVWEYQHILFFRYQNIKRCLGIQSCSQISFVLMTKYVLVWRQRDLFTSKSFKSVLRECTFFLCHTHSRCILLSCPKVTFIHF